MTSIKSESPTPSDISFKEEPESDSYEPPTKKTKGRVSRGGDKRKRASTKGQAWTPEERVKLFEAMLAGKKGAELEAAVPGRSAHKCQTTWANTLKPFIIRGIREGKSAK